MDVFSDAFMDDILFSIYYSDFPNFLGSHCFQNLGEGSFFFFFDSEISVSVKPFPPQVTLYVKIPVFIVGVVTKIPFPPLRFYLFIRLM